MTQKSGLRVSENIALQQTTPGPNRDIRRDVNHGRDTTRGSSLGISAMAAKQNILGLIDAGREVRRPPLVGMQFLHQGTVGTADVLRGRTGLNAKDLISFL